MKSDQTLIALFEQETQRLLKIAHKKKLNYLKNYKNLTGYQTFFEEHDYKIQANALNLDIEICTKSLGKRIIKTL